MIRIEEVLKNGENYHKLGSGLRKNISELLYKLNVVRYFYNKPMIVNSGYRSPEYNAKIGGAKNSWHTQGLAIDIADKSHEFYNWITESQTGIELYNSLGLYFEHEKDAPAWCHIQLRPPKSGNRVFRK